MENSSLVHREGTKITFSIYRNVRQGAWTYSLYKGLKIGEYLSESEAVGVLHKEILGSRGLENKIVIYKRLLKVLLAFTIGLVLALIIDRVQG